MASTFLETLINEVCASATDAPQLLDEPFATHIDNLATIWADDSFQQSTSIMLKYQFALMATGNVRFDKGQAPIQDADSLTKLRNALVHYKPSWRQFSSTDVQSGLEKRLVGRFAPNHVLVSFPFFPEQCLSHGCTEWAVYSALAFANDFHKRLGLTPGYLDNPELLMTSHPE